MMQSLTKPGPCRPTVGSSTARESPKHINAPVRYRQPLASQSDRKISQLPRYSYFLASQGQASRSFYMSSDILSRTFSPPSGVKPQSGLQRINSDVRNASRHQPALDTDIDLMRVSGRWKVSVYTICIEFRGRSCLPRSDLS